MSEPLSSPLERTDEPMLPFPPSDGSHETVALPPHDHEPTTVSDRIAGDGTLAEVAVDLQKRGAPDSPAALAHGPSPEGPFVPEPLDNPFTLASKHEKSKVKRNLLIAAGAAAVAGAITLVTVLSGHGHSSANAASKPESTAPAATAPRTVGETIPPIDRAATLTPASLDTKFLNLVVSDGSKQAADESYQYLSPAVRARISSTAWEAIVAKPAPVFTDHTPVLRNGPELLDASNTHTNVVANHFLPAGDGNYVVLVDESYNPRTDGWQVDDYQYAPTSQTS